MRFDEVGYWSEVKLEIIQKYATAYSVILNKQGFIKKYFYIDGFSGPGVHISKQTQEYIPGSPLNALSVNPPFHGYYFIDMDGDKAECLRAISGEYKNVTVYKGDCNKILLETVFPNIQYETYTRALCLLDPYGLHLNWDVIYTAGQSKAIEIFLNFPIMDMNMNILKKNPDKAEQGQIERMNRFWGDESWRESAYKKEPGLFEKIDEKTTNKTVVSAFAEKLKKVAGFQYVAQPLPMRNNKGTTVYYLMFASPNKTGHSIVNDIISKYEDRGK